MRPISWRLNPRFYVRPHSDIVTWLGLYAAMTPGVEAADNTTIRLDLDNEPQPDALLRIEDACGGQSRVSDDDYIEGAPELIVEIAASSASYDLYDKKNAYRRNGVQEYIVWQVADRTVSWFSLQGGRYVLLTPDAAGTLESRVFPGLRLNSTALIDGNLAEVIADVQTAMATTAHPEFVHDLAQQRSST